MAAGAEAPAAGGVWMAVVVRMWGSRAAIMQVCRICGVGVGVTRYPDGPFAHAEARFHPVTITLPGGERLHADDVCWDCARWATRNPARAARYLRSATPAADWIGCHALPRAANGDGNSPRRRVRAAPRRGEPARR
jgi:hypothetical protein